MTSHSKLKAKLEEKLSELLKRGEEIETTLSVAGNSDWEEKAVETENNEALAEIGDVTRQEIHDIKLALSRIDSGSYGKCSDCGKPIAKERLDAIPYTSTCIHCAK